MAIAAIERLGLMIGGEQRQAKSGATFETIDPSTSKPLAVIAQAGPEDIDDAVAVAKEAFENGPWTRLKPAERGRILWKMADLIRRDAEELAKTESRDNGKPLRQSKIDVEVAARYFEFYAGVADKLMGNTIPLGPVISKTQYEKILDYVEVGKREGASVAVGGQRAQDPRLKDGFFIEPTLLSDVRPEMRVHQEEIFGPVLTITPFSDLDEVAKLANWTDYGLLAGIWTRDINKAMYLAEKIKAGQVYINTYGAGGGVELPFGGYKKSGFGREKGLEALGSYLQTKNVCIKFA